MSIVLHIERLVLDEALLGVEPASFVRTVIEVELVRLLTQPDAIETLRRLGKVPALPSTMLPTAMPNQGLGLRIAMAVQQSLGIHSSNAAHKHSTARRI